MSEGTLSTKHKYAALLLASGRTAVDVARELHISPTTIHILRKRQDFQDEEARQRNLLMSSLRANLVERVIGTFDAAAEQSAAMVVELAQSGGKEQTRLSASKEVLDRSSVGLFQQQVKRKGQQGEGPQEQTVNFTFVKMAVEAAQLAGFGQEMFGVVQQMDEQLTEKLVSAEPSMPAPSKPVYHPLDNLDELDLGNLEEFERLAKED